MRTDSPPGHQTPDGKPCTSSPRCCLSMLKHSCFISSSRLSKITHFSSPVVNSNNCQGTAMKALIGWFHEGEFTNLTLTYLKPQARGWMIMSTNHASVKGSLLFCLAMLGNACGPCIVLSHDLREMQSGEGWPEMPALLAFASQGLERSTLMKLLSSLMQPGMGN